MKTRGLKMSLQNNQLIIYCGRKIMIGNIPARILLKSFSQSHSCRSTGVKCYIEGASRKECKIEQLNYTEKFCVIYFMVDFFSLKCLKHFTSEISFDRILWFTSIIRFLMEKSWSCQRYGYIFSIISAAIQCNQKIIK